MVGKTGDRNLGNSYRYVERYAKEIKLTPHQACIKVLRDVEKVLALVLNGRQEDEDNLYKAWLDGGEVKMDFDDFEFDLDPIEMGIALGFGEELAEDERERHRLQREMEQGNDLLNDVD